LALTIGITLRFIGVSMALLVVYLVLCPKAWSITKVKKMIAVIVLFEGIYFLSFLPISIFYLGSGLLNTLFIGYILETIAVFPPLTILSLKIWRFEWLKKQQLYLGLV
jgi:hypothetical protein